MVIRNYYRYALVVLILVLTLVVNGCSQQLKDQPGQTESAPDIKELSLEEEPWGPSEPTGRIDAAAFKGTDFLTGDEVEFAPGESDKPAIINFFSSG
ncbi:MAG: hypothetical protein ACOYEO_08555 [bacterium]|jgi:hypothetical protein